MNSLLIDELSARYRNGAETPASVMEAVLRQMDECADGIWITRLSRERVMEYALALAGKAPDSLPLYGIPFAIKDNIDLARVPTTAGCPAYTFVPSRSATVVQKLIDAGAIPVGKTNLDQFATGLVGTRSPYGVCRNSVDAAFISGGSSSGSAVAVASGLVSFALGTDTAGSGRVPAAFNNLIGLKPTFGLLSTSGVVPACRSLDCVSIFALSASDADRVFQAARGYDELDAYSRQPEEIAARAMGSTRRFGVPRPEQLEFCGDTEYQRLFAAAIEKLAALGWERVEIDLAPFIDAARLLYEGPWIAERSVAVGEFVAANPDAVHPVTRQIIAGAGSASAVDLFRAQHRLMELKRVTASTWKQIDVLVTPTAPTIFRIDEVLRDPIALNLKLGHYTNFVNLLDLAGVAVPAGFRSDGLPSGVTLVAPAGTEALLLQLASELHHASVATTGALQTPVPSPRQPASGPGFISVAVCGAHMDGLPLNHQLRTRGARFLSATRTSPAYRFFALPGGPPERPGLVRVASGGAAVDVEVWSVPEQSFGSFVAGIPSPLGIGKVELSDGSWCPGFICEASATENAREITQLGGWRRYLSEKR